MTSIVWNWRQKHETDNFVPAGDTNNCRGVTEDIQKLQKSSIVRDLLNQKKSVKFHTGGGRGLDKFGSFSIFFLLVLIHAYMQRKLYFVGGGGTSHLKLGNFCIFH